MPLTVAQRNALLDLVLREIAYTPPDGLFISLHSADPGDTGASELAATGAYARVQVRPTGAGAGIMVAAAAASSSNGSDILFPEATANWAAATHFGLWSLASGGTFIGGAALAASKTANTGVAIRIPAGSLTVPFS